MNLMDMTTEEILSANKNYTYEKTDRNGTRYFSDYTCPRCGGTGVIESYKYVDSGTCFGCDGSGKVEMPTIIKVYTKAHREKLDAAAAKRNEERKKAKQAKFSTDKFRMMSEMGFGDEDGVMVLYRVVGDTFPIHEELKALGCRYHSTIGWYSPIALDNYTTQRLTQNEVLDINFEACTIQWKDEAALQARCVETKDAADKASKSQWQGVPGASITIYNCHVDRKLIVDGYMGKSAYLYIMSDEGGNIYRWTTSKDLLCDHTYNSMSGAVKDHSVYKTKQGVIVKQTVVTRMKVNDRERG